MVVLRWTHATVRVEAVFVRAFAWSPFKVKGHSSIHSLFS
jgi:hypothetical protein